MHETTQEVRAPPSARPRVALRAVGGGRSVRIARGAALAAMAIGASVLVGWWIGEPRLTGAIAGWPATAADTALACLLSGASLWAVAPAEVTRRARLLGAACALGALLFAAIAIVELVVGRDLGVDRLLVGGAAIARAPGHDQPSLRTALCFALLGAALLLVVRPGSPARAAQVAAALAGAVAVFALLGYFFGVPAMYGVEEYEPLFGMGALTSLAVLSLSAGALAVRPNVGAMAVLTSPGQGGVAARRLLVGLLMIAPMAVAVQLAARAGWLPALFAAALIVFFGLLLGTALVLRTATRLDRTGAELGAALAEATRWKRMFDSSAIAAAVASPSGAILAANPAFALLHGGEAREILGRSLGELLPRAEHQALEARLAALGPGEHDTIEMSHAAPDGRERVALVDATAIAGADGRTAYLAIYVRDVTEDRRADRDRARLASLVDSSDDAIVAKTLEGRVLSWNAAAELMYGYSPREMIGESILRVVPPERASELTRFLAAIGRGERVRSHETVRIRRDGSRFPVSLTLSPILDAEGRVVGASSIARDISARLALEHALRRSEEQYRAFFELAPEGIFIADLDGRYTDVNRAGAAMLGYERHELVGKSITDLLRPEDVERLRASREVQLRGGVEVGEWELRRADGSHLPAEVSAKMLPDGRWQGFVRDISERRRAAEALRELERLREEWASVVAHDLRQPVTVIHLAAQLLSLGDGSRTETERSAVTRIRGAASRLDRMIGDLLDVSRIEAERLSLRRRVVDLRRLVERTVEELRDITAGHEVRVAGDEPIPAWVDPDRIVQVLGNLLSNAVKYGEPGGPIEVSVRRGDGEARVTVTDRGRGIPDEELVCLFTRFSRTREARAGRAPGLGLGLYITRGLVEAHGGRIEAENVPGVGTRFSVTLPAMAQAQAELTVVTDDRAPG